MASGLSSASLGTLTHRRAASPGARSERASGEADIPWLRDVPAPSRWPDLTFLVALILAGAVAAMKGYQTDQGKGLGDAVMGKIKDAVDKVQF